MPGRKRSINIKGTRNTPSYLVNSTLSFFMTRSFSNNSSSSSSVPRAANLRFRSANPSLFSQTCTTCCMFSFLRFSRARSILASSNDCASSDCKRYSNSLSEDVVCEFRCSRLSYGLDFATAEAYVGFIDNVRLVILLEICQTEEMECERVPTLRIGIIQ